jgi:hypothetical protein
MFAARSEFGPDAASVGGLMASLVGTGRSSADRLQSPVVGSLDAARSMDAEWQDVRQRPIPVRRTAT